MTENTENIVPATTPAKAPAPSPYKSSERPSRGAPRGASTGGRGGASSSRGGSGAGAPAGRGAGAGGRKGGSARGGRGGAFERVKPEFDSKLIQIRRVTRVVAGGRRFAFSVALVAGNRKGSVGVGIGKAADTAQAIEKATKNAKKNMIKVLLTSGMMIPHEVKAKESSSTVMIMPAKGRGMVAGSSARNVLELAGIKDVRAKILSGSKNKLNNARATIKALQQLRLKGVKDVAPAKEVAKEEAEGKI